jgi:hypothetical protein
MFFDRQRDRERGSHRLEEHERPLPVVARATEFVVCRWLPGTPEAARWFRTLADLRCRDKSDGSEAQIRADSTVASGAYASTTTLE